MMNVLDFIEKHPTLVTALVPIVLLCLSGIRFLIKRKFSPDYEKDSPSIKAGGDISAGGDIIVGGLKTVNQAKNEADKNLRTFEHFVEHSSWHKELIGNTEVWMCNDDNTYQIDLSTASSDFSEDWTKVYPNAIAFFKPILLKIGGVTIKEESFVYCDETRIFVPLPEKIVHDDLKTYHYEWHRNSLKFKLARVIGNYYIYKNIEEIARISKVKII